MVKHDFVDIHKVYSLTTPEILNRMPDHRLLLQSYNWQDYDLHPKFPRLREFLDFWEAHLDGPLYKVTVNHRQLIAPAELKLVDADYSLN